MRFYHIRLPLFILCCGAANAAVPVPFSTAECLVELDASVAVASAPDAETAIEQLEWLSKRCANVPQIQHNLGVLMARQQRWPQAIAYFEESLAGDQRAAHTASHLREIFRYRAARAYASALNTSVQTRPPKLNLQDSTHFNADTLRTLHTQSDLHTISTVEYELYAWWQARQDDIDVIREHYVDDYPEIAIDLATERYTDLAWSAVQREIAFTRHDAVVVLSAAVDEKTLLLLRLDGTRWKIYQETVL